MARLAEQQLAHFKSNFDKVDLRYARKNLTAYDVLIIASLVERESMLAKERPVIASVIYNRLKRDIRLDIDATTRFAVGNWKRPLRESELQNQSPYNTRIHTGLPPGPIGNPGLDSIRAAARPAKTGFLFYVVKPGTCGKHNFAKTDAEFQGYVNGLQQPPGTRTAASRQGLLSTLAGVLGFPVAHSRSPVMINAAFRELGLDWRYVKLPVPPELFEETVRALPGSGYRGANVTIPHKLAAHDLADELSEAARAIGAANTLTFGEDGRIIGDNTDAGGLLDALGEPLPPTALVLGAGGAARAAVWALAQGGVEVTVWNRTPERADELAADLGVLAAERPGPAPTSARERHLGRASPERLRSTRCRSSGLEPGVPRSSSCTAATAPTPSPAGPRSVVCASSTASRCSCARERRASSSGPGRSRPWIPCAERHEATPCPSLLKPGTTRADSTA